MALKVAFRVSAGAVKLHCPGEAHLRDHLVRAARNTGLALAEASGHTGGNRWLHLERSYAENQEIQADLEMLAAAGVEVPHELAKQANRLGGLIFGLMRSFLAKGG